MTEDHSKAPFDLPPEASESPRFSLFLECYRDACGKRSTPARDDLPLRKFAPLMSDITIAERQRPGDDIVYRLIGTGVARRLGRDPTGAAMFDLFRPVDIDRVRRAADEIVSRPCGFFSRQENTYASGDIALADCLSLPLRTDGSGTDHVIMSLHENHRVRPGLVPEPDPVVATRWIETTFIDLGHGTP